MSVVGCRIIDEVGARIIVRIGSRKEKQNCDWRRRKNEILKGRGGEREKKKGIDLNLKP